MKALFTADLHLTMREIDDYRWEIWPWLYKQGINRKVDAFIIAGDLTDSKDNHGARLVNRLTLEILTLAKVAPVYIISGNHDYIDPKVPFFSFLLAFASKGVHFFTKPTERKIAGKNFLFFPHMMRMWFSWDSIKVWQPDFVILHQAITGAKSSNGSKISGTLPNDEALFNSDALYIAGDQHVPQRIFGVYYCGAPYPVRFGDEYQPRVLYYDGTGLNSINRTTLRKATLSIESVEDLKSEDLTGGDMVQIEYQLPRSEYSSWPTYRREVLDACIEMDLRLCGLTVVEKINRILPVTVTGFDRQASEGPSSSEVLFNYCRNCKVDPRLQKLGQKLLGE